MAEFVEVMKHRERMCKSSVSNCISCGLYYSNNSTGYDCVDFSEHCPEKAEQIIMAWAADHPEPKYPSWDEAWKQLFPDAYLSTNRAQGNAPCLEHFLQRCPSDDKQIWYRKCRECRSQPIPADIAEKLGIKPLEG